MSRIRLSPAFALGCGLFVSCFTEDPNSIGTSGENTGTDGTGTTGSGSVGSSSGSATSGSDTTGRGTSGTTTDDPGTGSTGQTASGTGTTGDGTTTTGSSSATGDGTGLGTSGGTGTTGAIDPTTSGTGATTGEPDPCGNGQLDPQEVCDPGPAYAYSDGCLPSCTLEHFECNPLVDIACPTLGQKCAADGDTFGCFTGGGGTPAGDPCTTNAQCDPGTLCLGGDLDCAATDCCTPFCDVNDASSCPPGKICSSWWSFSFATPAGPGLDHLGICRPAP